MGQKKPGMHWLKLWTRGWLEGSIRFDLTAANRSVFIDLVAMARESRNPPWVQANETTAYPHSWLANKLNVPLGLLEETLKICEAQERIFENSNGIKILKFDYYQDREQKLYLRRKPKEQAADMDKELAAISKLYEENIGQLGPVIAEKLKTIADTYPPGWFKEALGEAVEAGVRKLSYIEAILERWSVEGFKAPRKKGERGEQQSRTHQRGTKEPSDERYRQSLKR